ncbi:hypothetical protein [Alkalihalobacillus sp. R86527]|uniref:hypothetical protein n=1 Tax=Alkalihalobacillus sp. R86527 TaxID=3093863 RepID=UPI00366A93DF
MKNHRVVFTLLILIGVQSLTINTTFANGITLSSDSLQPPLSDEMYPDPIITNPLSDEMYPDPINKP